MTKRQTDRNDKKKEKDRQTEGMTKRKRKTDRQKE